MSQFIGDHYTFSDATRLLSGISRIVEENDSNNYDFYTQSEQLAVINNHETKIYHDLQAYEENNQIIPDFTLPTPHFKTIVEAWKNFLGR